jgi:hypothetical protein
MVETPDAFGSGGRRDVPVNGTPRYHRKPLTDMELEERGHHNTRAVAVATEMTPRAIPDGLVYEILHPVSFPRYNRVLASHRKRER